MKFASLKTYKLRIWKLRTRNSKIRLLFKKRRVPHCLLNFVKMGTRKNENWINGNLKNLGYEIHIDKKPWDGNLMPFVFSSKGIPSTPQHTDRGGPVAWVSGPDPGGPAAQTGVVPYRILAHPRLFLDFSVFLCFVGIILVFVSFLGIPWWVTGLNWVINTLEFSLIFFGY